MKKARHDNNRSIHDELRKKFGWITSQRRIATFLPGATETQLLTFDAPIDKIERHFGRGKLERHQLEEFICEFYGVHKGKHQVVCCWRETGVVYIVF